MASPQPQAYCPPPGFSLPPPVDASKVNVEPFSSSAFSTYPWFNTTTFTIKATIGESPILEYGHRAGESGGTTGLFETKFRLASVTKVFTVLAVLLTKNIGWEDSITKYLPELDAHSYGKVSIGALASQTSGLGRFGYVGDLSFVPTFKPSALGIATTNATLPGCDPFPGGKVCTPSQVLDMFNNPLYAPRSPNSGPLYSNIAYNLLGKALEAVHQNQTYPEIIQKLIFDPLKMTTTSFDTPKNRSEAILPGPTDTWFAAEFGNFDASGGIWSTPNDLQRFAQGLRKHTLLCAASTRKWLQPVSLVPSLHQLVGAPWEILRPTDLAVKVGRPINIYTKAGGVTGYTSYVVLIPEYDVTITITAAGNAATAAIKDLLPLAVKPVVEYADRLAVEQASAKYAGTYKGTAGANSSITLTLDGGPGLKIASWTMNGVQVLPALAAVQSLDPKTASARIYPTDADAWGEGTEVFRMQLDRTLSASLGFAELDCGSWNWGDPARYVGAALERMSFKVGEGKVAAMELEGWGASLEKTS